jgi:hypothetical protein
VTLFESQRTFQLWRAVVGHSQLLLRSTKTGPDASRIDILFKPVQAMKLRATFDGIRIREAEPEEESAIAADAAQDVLDGFKVFVIESASFRGYVIASVLLASEDDGEYSDPSSLLVE